jgi:hypothetical protein
MLPRQKTDSRAITTTTTILIIIIITITPSEAV